MNDTLIKSQFSNLRKLDVILNLGENNSNDIKSFSKFTTITHLVLDICRNNFYNRLQEVLEVLLNSKSLNYLTLNLNHCLIGSAGLISLSIVIGSMSCISSLILSPLIIY